MSTHTPVNATNYVQIIPCDLERYIGNAGLEIWTSRGNFGPGPPNPACQCLHMCGKNMWLHIKSDRFLRGREGSDSPSPGHNSVSRVGTAEQHPFIGAKNSEASNVFFVCQREGEIHCNNCAMKIHMVINKNRMSSYVLRVTYVPDWISEHLCNGAHVTC